MMLELSSTKIRFWSNRHLTGRAVTLPWTRSRAYRKNDNAHCEQKNWTHMRQLFGHERFGHPELVALMNDLYAQEWSHQPLQADVQVAQT